MLELWLIDLSVFGKYQITEGKIDFFGNAWIMIGASRQPEVLGNKWKLIFKYYRSILDFSSNIQNLIFVRKISRLRPNANLLILWKQRLIARKINLELCRVSFSFYFPLKLISKQQFVLFSKSSLISCQSDRFQCHWHFQSKKRSKTNWSKATTSRL